MKRLALLLTLALSLSAYAQYPVLIHSHNDYAQQAPFWLAYAVKANSVECDMFHVGGSKFLIGHGTDDFCYNQIFDVWYLDPIVQVIRYNGGHAWNDDENRPLQLLIDVKSGDTDTFLKALCRKLGRYPDVFDPRVNPHACQVVISGNTPAPEDFDRYPAYLLFDSKLSNEYTASQLERVAMFSEYFRNWSSWDGKSELSAGDEQHLKEAVEKAHALGKPIRFWEAPDTQKAWDKFIELGFDYINTDKLVSCTEHLKACAKPHGARTVAHRGYWDIEGSAQNSRESLRQAGEHGFYGSEFDVNLTADGELVINHDFDFHGIRISENPYSAIKDLTLDNGETIATLDEYLDIFCGYPELHLVFELKSEGDPDYESRAIPLLIQKLEDRGLCVRTDFISFSLGACREVARRKPGMMVEYLGGEVSPAELKSMGINGIDYHISVFREHPEWVAEAHALGMVVNVWTVNDTKGINDMIALGADFITTNSPELSEALAKIKH